MNIFFGRILLFGPTVWRQAAVSFRLRNWLLVESSACRTLHIPWARNVRSGELSEGHSSCKQGAFARLAGVYLNSLQQTVGRHSWAQWITKTQTKIRFRNWPMIYVLIPARVWQILTKNGTNATTGNGNYVTRLKLVWKNLRNGMRKWTYFWRI